MKRYRIKYRYDTLEMDDEDDFNEAIIGFVSELIKGLEGDYGQFLGFEETKS